VASAVVELTLGEKAEKGFCQFMMVISHTAKRCSKYTLIRA
jgi:hypothetical protein